MVHLLSVTALAACMMMALAEDQVSPLRVIPLQQRNGPLLNTPARLQRVLKKYGLASHTMADENASTGVVDLASAFVDVEYVGMIGIGTPPQMFHMDFDTGSADVWVPTTPCYTCGTRELFQPSGSTSFSNASSAEWSLRYGDGSGVRGTSAYEKMSIDGLTFGPQLVGLVHEQSIDFVRDRYLDGIFGLAFPPLSYTGSKKTVVDTMKDSGLISEAKVGVWLGRARDGGAGEIVFGGDNPLHYRGPLQYVPVTSKRYWTVSLDDVKIDEKSIVEQPMDVIVDTGTTLIILPPSYSKRIHSAIPGAMFSNIYGWRMPCNLGDVATTVTFVLGGKSFPINVADLVRERSTDGNLCYSGVAEANTPTAILGDTFLRSYYSVYDYENARVGFAPSV